MNELFDFGIILDNSFYLAKGIHITLEITGLALAIGIVLGMGGCLAKLAKHRAVSFPASAYIELFRNTPVLVQLIWLNYLLPIVFGFEIGVFVACVIALGLNTGAYMADTFRAGIQSVDRGQIEAAYSVGLSHLQTLRKVTLPQAIRAIIPPFINRVVALMKGTAICSVLAVPELTYRATAVSVETFRVVEIYTMLAVVYVVILVGLSSLGNFFDRRFAASR